MFVRAAFDPMQSKPRKSGKPRQSCKPAAPAQSPKARAVPSCGLVCGDVIDTLDRLPSGVTFDLVIADPPYNIGKDFGNESDRLPLADYLQWSQQWLARCLDRLSENGLIYVYGFPEILARIAAHHPIDQQRWLVWHYINKAVPSSTFWQRSHESILCLWRGGRRPVLEIDQIREPYTDGYQKCIGRTRAGTDSRYGGQRGRRTTYRNHGGALPRDVIKIPALAGGAGASERWFLCRDCGRRVYPPAQIKNHRGHDILKHPTQKPMALTRRLIASKMNGGGGRVLIPFAGSGSECLVAQQMGYDWLGIELNREYVAFATQWLEQIEQSIACDAQDRTKIK
ncbi:MAG: site-specific DNA-methyltransferase [Pseudomonadota bacterium]